jgi:GT2 family glycosyltransferase
MSTPNAQSARVEASIIVVTHNNDAFIEDCLHSVEAAFTPGSCEIIVVDNRSTDRTNAIVGRHKSGPRLVELDSNVGFARAVNAGITVSRGRLIVLVNSDAFPDPGSIDALVRAIDGLPAAGIVGGRLRYPTGRLQPSAGRFPSLLGGLWMALLLHRLPLSARLGFGVNAHPALYRARRRVDWVTAAFCIARRDLRTLPTRAFMYGEDVEWARACADAGFEVWFEPAASAVHIGRATVAARQDAGFAQRQRAQFELAWFADRRWPARLAARGVLVMHALVRLPIYLAVASIRLRRDPRVGEYTELLRAALSRHRRSD